MPALLTTSDTLICQFTATVTLAGDSKLVINGTPVLTKAKLIGCSCVGCKPPGSPPPPPCVSVFSVSGGLATKLTVSGSEAILPSVSATTEVATGHSISMAPGPPTQSKMEAI